MTPLFSCIPLDSSFVVWNLSNAWMMLTKTWLLGLPCTAWTYQQPSIKGCCSWSNFISFGIWNSLLLNHCCFHTMQYSLLFLTLYTGFLEYLWSRLLVDIGSWLPLPVFDSSNSFTSLPNGHGLNLNVCSNSEWVAIWYPDTFLPLWLHQLLLCQTIPCLADHGKFDHCLHYSFKSPNNV